MLLTKNQNHITMTMTSNAMLPVHSLAKQLVGLLISSIIFFTYYIIAHHALCGGNIQELLMLQQAQQQPQNQQQQSNFQIAEAAVTPTATPAASPDFRVPTGPPGDGRSTVIVTSNLIPSHPSIWMINETISSIPLHVIGLEPDFRLVLGVDGPKQGTKRSDRSRFRGYVKALERTYPHADIRIISRSAGLTRNVLAAINNVSTEFVYLMQHDMPFCCNPINHKGLMEAARATQGYPFNVRFNKIQNIPMGINRGKCWAARTTLASHHGLEFTKTPSWSDNNQFATAAYYRHMFSEWISPNYEKRPMEYRMQLVASRTEDKCLGYGQYLYGRKKEGPHIGHLDGRNTPQGSMPTGNSNTTS